MLGNLLMALASLIHTGPSMTFHEASITIPEGTSKIETEMEWNAITLFSPEGNPLPNISYQDDNGNFLEWHKNEENELYPESALELLFVGRSNPLIIRSDAPVKLVAHFLNTRIPEEKLLVEAGTSDGTKFAPLDPDEFDDPETGLPPLVEQPKYIARETWGADEKLLAWKSNQRSLRRWFHTEEDLVEPQYRPRIVQTKNKYGDELFWPVSENQKIAKIIIHHTAEATKNERNPMEIMRAIYVYHTVTRGWGDIGYNFVLDQEGNIYEGRLGSREGAMPVGAHVAYHNIGTIGVALMGNFQIEEPRERTMQVLTLLLAKLARDYDVDPLGRDFYLGTNSYNISGHGDVARHGHATACPGTNLKKRLPELRREVAFWKNELHRQEKNNSPDARDFLQKSTSAPDVLKKETPWERPEKVPLISFAKIITTPIVQRNDRLTLNLEIQNGTQEVWTPQSAIKVENVPEGMIVTDFRSLAPIAPKESGIFRGRIIVEDTQNGTYNLGLIPTFLKSKLFRDQTLPTFPLAVQVSGDRKFKISANNVYKAPEKKKPSFLKNLTASTFRSSAPIKRSEEPMTKVRLSYFKEAFARVKANAEIQIREKENILASIPANASVKIVPQKDEEKNILFLEVSTDEQVWKVAEVSLITDGILEITNYDRGLSKHTPYNTFRRELFFSAFNKKEFLVVNKLPIEEYLYGLAEEPSTEHINKKKTIEIAARNYVLAYSGAKRKFGTLLFDLDDSPERSQFYLGEGWERYHGDQKISVDSTRGIVATYQGQPVVLPYFTQSDGRTSDKWSKAYPWTKSQILPFDEGLTPRGHGVGMSAHTAGELAEQGKIPEKILQYFFDGIKVEKVY